MEKIAIMTDVNAGLDYTGRDYDIKVLRSIINFGDEHYIDGIDINAYQFYERLVETKEIPSTSAPTIGEAMSYLDKMIEDGFTDVIMYAISFKLSSIGVMMETLAEEYKGKINVHVIDTKAAINNQGYLAEEAYRMAQAGKSVKEIIDYSNYLIESGRMYFVVDDIMHLVKNGRLSGAKGIVGSLLKVKPILQVNGDGYIVAYGKERTHTRAIEKAFNYLLEDTKDAKKVKLNLFHTCREEEIKGIKKDLEEKFDKFVDIETHVVTPAVGAHIGCGVIGFGYFILEK